MQMDRRSRSEMRYICETGEFQTGVKQGKVMAVKIMDGRPTNENCELACAKWVNVTKSYWDKEIKQENLFHKMGTRSKIATTCLAGAKLLYVQSGWGHVDWPAAVMLAGACLSAACDWSSQVMTSDG